MGTKSGLMGNYSVFVMLMETIYLRWKNWWFRREKRDSEEKGGEFPGGAVARLWHCKCCGMGSIPSQEPPLPTPTLQKKRKERIVKQWIGKGDGI